MRRLLLMLVMFLLLIPNTAQAAQEKILSYDTLITVQDDATVIVTETITVQSAGIDIRRGIYRDFPTVYQDSYRNRVKIDFLLLSAERDGKEENYRIERISNGLRIYLGREDVFLNPGVYTYTITYQVKRALGFFAEHDELYWNVTGNDWAFPIERSSATVRLPQGAALANLQTKAYTGFQGDTGQDYTVTQTDSGAIFTTTRGLAPGEGLTIAVGWPKGFVPEPTSQDKLAWFFQDNRGTLVILMGLFLVLIWYLFAWNRVGRDPEKGVIFPRYAPPEGYSPAAIRYIRRMKFDNKAFTAGIINLAVAGRLTIEEQGKQFVLINTGETAAVAPEEEKIHSTFFKVRHQLTLENSNHTIIRRALTACRKHLTREYYGKYFQTNTNWLIPGALLSIASFILGIIFSDGNFLPFFFLIWLSFWSLGTGAILQQVRNSWLQGSKASAVGMGCFAIPFVLGWFGGLGAMIFLGGAVISLTLAGLVGLNLLFYHLLKRPTYGGRRLLDDIEGFKMFLEVAEKDYLQWSAPLERTPELFEKFLPYALALDVDQQWAEKFAGILAQSSMDGGYRPVWYHGHSLHSFSPGAFADGLSSSFNSAVASSGVAPGSSSGFSGGSSGGGGGGGGGGGW